MELFSRRMALQYSIPRILLGGKHLLVFFRLISRQNFPKNQAPGFGKRHSFFQIPSKSTFEFFWLFHKNPGQLHKNLRVPAFASKAEGVHHPKSIKLRRSLQKAPRWLWHRKQEAPAPGLLRHVKAISARTYLERRAGVPSAQNLRS